MLDLGTALLIWILVGTLAHEYGHSFTAKICSCKTIGFIVNSSGPGVLTETPRKQTHAILILAGGCIFNVVLIILFLPFVVSDYILLFLIIALAIEIILSSGWDFIKIWALLASALILKEDRVKDMWAGLEDVAKEHNRKARFGLSKIVIVDRTEYEKTLKNSIQHEHSIAFFDKMDVKGWMVLFSLLTLETSLMILFVILPFYLLLFIFEIEVEVGFLIFFWAAMALVGITFILTLAERLILHYHKK